MPATPKRGRGPKPKRWPKKEFSIRRPCTDAEEVLNGLQKYARDGLPQRLPRMSTLADLAEGLKLVNDTYFKSEKLGEALADLDSCLSDMDHSSLATLTASQQDTLWQSLRTLMYGADSCIQERRQDLCTDPKKNREMAKNCRMVWSPLGFPDRSDAEDSNRPEANPLGANFVSSHICHQIVKVRGAMIEESSDAAPVAHDIFTFGGLSLEEAVDEKERFRFVKLVHEDDLPEGGKFPTDIIVARGEHILKDASYMKVIGREISWSDPVGPADGYVEMTQRSRLVLHYMGKAVQGLFEQALVAEAKSDGMADEDIEKIETEVKAQYKDRGGNMAFWPNSKKSDYEEARSAENSNTDSDGSPLTAQSSSSTTDTEAINADISGDDLEWEDSEDTVSPGMDESESDETRRKFPNGRDTDLEIFDPESDMPSN